MTDTDATPGPEEAEAYAQVTLLLRDLVDLLDRMSPVMRGNVRVHDAGHIQALWALLFRDVR